MGLHTACSIRVGTLLGEGDPVLRTTLIGSVQQTAGHGLQRAVSIIRTACMPARAVVPTRPAASSRLHSASHPDFRDVLMQTVQAGAKGAAFAGISYNVGLGLVLCVLLIVFRDGIAAFMVPNEADRLVKEMTSDALVPLAVLVLLTALQWGLVRDTAFPCPSAAILPKTDAFVCGAAVVGPRGPGPGLPDQCDYQHRDVGHRCAGIGAGARALVSEALSTTGIQCHLAAPAHSPRANSILPVP